MYVSLESKVGCGSVPVRQVKAGLALQIFAAGAGGDRRPWPLRRPGGGPKRGQKAFDSPRKTGVVERKRAQEMAGIRGFCR